MRHSGRLSATEEGDAAAGIVLPAILPVENDTDQGRLRPGYRLPDAAQVEHEILGSRHRVAALVMEADGASLKA